ncbi:alpha/beta hydrolase fold domain-containing protein [Streptomyces sp. NPDC005438]|uniref:alpha/beta hydrolase n=1 Tax=Streptomyces sp. NPDC005438 TaxID=3156880 RepID=UPI0033B79EF2
MPLDRIFRSLIAWQHADGPPVPARALTVEQVRERYRANSVRPGALDDAIGTADHTVRGADGSAVPCRVYTPAGPAPKRVMTYLHGGGWVAGDLDSHDRVCRLVADALGAVVVSVGYRRAPEAPYPAALVDAVAAARWTSRSFPGLLHVIGGDSAGASLAVGVAMEAREAGGPEFAAQLLVCPPTDPSLLFAASGDCAEGYFLTVDDMAWYYDMYVPDVRRRGDPAIDLLHADLRNLPPAVIGTAEFDPLRDEGVELADKFAVCDVAVRHVPGPGLVHDYFVMHDLVPAAATRARRVLQELDALLEARGAVDGTATPLEGGRPVPADRAAAPAPVRGAGR